MSQGARRKKTRKKPMRKIRGGGSWSMLVIGLVSGSILAYMILGTQDRGHDGFGSGLKTLLTRLSTDQPSLSTTVRKSSEAETAPKAKLDFYTVLPRIERIISEPVIPKKQQEVERKPESVTYVLQAAAYTNFNEADRLKAQLTITGFDAKVQKVTVEDTVYYRVRLGPYQSEEKMEEVEGLLREQGIQAMSLKVVDP